MKRAFTLIELLVVIAIIAILAAILFPVFAQAKAAAKKTAALSNIKEMGLAAQMYGGDADDQPPLLMAGGNKYNGSTYGTLTWIDSIQPYTKNYDLAFDPVSPYNKRGGYGSTPVTYGSFAHYWMSLGGLPTAASVGGGGNPWTTRTSAWFQNYTKAGLSYDGIMGVASDKDESYWGAYGGFAPGEQFPSRSFTAVSSPANYSLFFSSNNFDAWHAIYGYAALGGNGFGYCGGWQGYDYGFIGFQPRHGGGADTCDTDPTHGAAFRGIAYGKGQALSVFADGHAKSMNPGALLQTDSSGTRLADFSPDAS